MRLRTTLFLIGLALSLSAQPGARYLIIAHDNFYDAIQPLVEWKHQKGISDTVVRLSQIGSTANQIRAFIMSAWNNWDPRPEYLLLVGSGYYIPAFARGHGEDALYSDNMFADMTGDYRAELMYGRLPCNSARQCSVMVAKTLAYERTPYMTDTIWFRRGTTVVADSGDSDGWLYCADAQFYAGLAGAAGYAGIDSLFSSRHDDQDDVVRSINNGTSFVLYRGTAGANWWLPFMVNPVQTTNGTRLPIICSFTCQTEALNRYDSMVGETWLRVGTPQNLKGAVAFLGNTHSASHVAAPRSAVTRSFFEGVFSESLQHMGKLALRAKDSIFAGFHDSLEYFGFNLLGDPELCVWTTTPEAIQVSYDSVIPGPESFAVTVQKAGAPLAGAIVCVLDHNSIYETGVTDSMGSVLLALDPRLPGTLQVTVTGFNRRPFEGTARIAGAAVAEPPIPHSAFRAPQLLTVSPNPGSGRFAISVSDIRNVAIYNACGELVQRFEFPQSAGMSPRSAVWDARGMPSGVYMVRSLGSGGIQAVRVVRLVR